VSSQALETLLVVLGVILFVVGVLSLRTPSQSPGDDHVGASIGTKGVSIDLHGKGVPVIGLGLLPIVFAFYVSTTTPPPAPVIPTATAAPVPTQPAPDPTTPPPRPTPTPFTPPAPTSAPSGQLAPTATAASDCSTGSQAQQIINSIGRSGSGCADVSGTWHNPSVSGVTYVVLQQGSAVQMQETTPYGITATGSGAISGRAVVIDYYSQLTGTAGRLILQVSDDGREMAGTELDASGAYRPISFVR